MVVVSMSVRKLEMLLEARFSPVFQDCGGGRVLRSGEGEGAAVEHSSSSVINFQRLSSFNCPIESSTGNLSILRGSLLCNAFYYARRTTLLQFNLGRTSARYS